MCLEEFASLVRVPFLELFTKIIKRHGNMVSYYIQLQTQQEHAWG